MKIQDDKVRCNRLVVLGLGSIATALLPLIQRHIDIDPKDVTIIADHDPIKIVLDEYGFNFIKVKLDESNYLQILRTAFPSRGALVNLTVNVSSYALILACRDLGVLYLDTANEPWLGETATSSTVLSRRLNGISNLKKGQKGEVSALIYHGANPGIVSHLAKRALLTVAGNDKEVSQSLPPVLNRREWQELAERLRVRALHISEVDCQASNESVFDHKYVNTWSVNGFLSEAAEPASMSWGTHENVLGSGYVGNIVEGDCTAIEFSTAGWETRCWSWVPSYGAFQGYVIAHPEAFSIAAYLRHKRKSGAWYQPSVAFVYRPCDAAIKSMQKASHERPSRLVTGSVLMEEICSGYDELGVLVLLEGTRKVLWYGSRVDIDTARSIAPNNNATSLQVVAGVISGLVWLLSNPSSGLVEPEDIDGEFILQVASPYLGKLGAKWGELQMSEDDTSDGLTWKFQNLRGSSQEDRTVLGGLDKADP